MMESFNLRSLLSSSGFRVLEMMFIVERSIDDMVKCRGMNFVDLIMFNVFSGSVMIDHVGNWHSRFLSFDSHLLLRHVWIHIVSYGRFLNYDHLSIIFLVNKIGGGKLSDLQLTYWNSYSFGGDSSWDNGKNMSTFRSIIINIGIFFTVNKPGLFFFFTIIYEILFSFRI